ncbi:hypothetical protein D9M73_151060 [compost metagenome]
MPRTVRYPRHSAAVPGEPLRGAQKSGDVVWTLWTSAPDSPAADPVRRDAGTWEAVCTLTLAGRLRTLRPTRHPGLVRGSTGVRYDRQRERGAVDAGTSPA